VSIFGVNVLPRSRKDPQIDLPRGAQLLVPVLSASGSGGRTTVAGLLSAAFARVAKTVMVDGSTPALSPWSSWVTQPPPKLAGWRHDRDATAAGLRAACATQHLGPHSWNVLSPEQAARRAHPHQRLPVPGEIAELVREGGWSVAVVDTARAALVDLCDAPDPMWSSTAAWLADLPTSPVLTSLDTLAGLERVHRLVTACERLGLACARVAVTLVAAGPGPRARRVRVAATVLDGRVGALVRVPYDPQIASAGLSRPQRVRAPTIRAAGVLAAALVELSPGWATLAGSRAGDPGPVGAQR